MSTDTAVQAQQERPYLNAEQVAVIKDLTHEYGIDPGDIMFLDSGEPWLSSRVRLEIARKSEVFESISEGFDQFIPALSQVVHSAEVMTRAGRSFRRSGVAEIGETLANSEKADAHELAASRALGAALDAAGFNPLKKKRSARMKIDFEAVDAGDPAQVRLNQLKVIHLLAKDAGLIAFNPDTDRQDDTEYRKFLAQHWRVISASGMNETERASVIAALRIRAREVQKAQEE